MTLTPERPVSSMSGGEFRSRLRELGRSHASFAREIGSSLRSVDRWASIGPPNEIAYLVDLLSELELQIGKAKPEAPSEIGGLTFLVQLDALLERAVIEGKLEEFVQSVRDWIALRHLDDFGV